MAHLGELIAELRQDKGLTQKELGDILCVSSGTISNYENGVHLPDVDKVIALANYFHVTTDYLQRTSVLKVFAYLESNPIIDIQKTATSLDMSYNTVAKAVSILIDNGILEQTDKSGKAKIYSYIEYLNILRKDT